MTAREAIAYNVGRDGAHRESRPAMTVAERASYPSQRSQARLLRYRIGCARARRVGACMREDTAQGGRR